MIEPILSLWTSLLQPDFNQDPAPLIGPQPRWLLHIKKKKIVLAYFNTDAITFNLISFHLNYVIFFLIRQRKLMGYLNNAVFEVWNVEDFTVRNIFTFIIWK